MMRTEIAPWQRPGVDATRQQSVLRQLPTRVKERLDKPVTEAATLAFLTARASAFRIGAVAVPATLDRGAVIDVGADVAGESRFASGIDLDKSAALVASIKQGTGGDRATAHVSAVLSSHLIPATGGTQYRDTLFVSVVQKDMSRVALWRVENGTYKRLYDSAVAGVQAKTLSAVPVQSIGALPSSAVLSGSIATPVGDAYSAYDQTPKKGFGEACVSPSDCASNSCAPTPPTGTTSSWPGSGPTSSSGASLNIPGKCVPTAGTGETGDFCTHQSQCKSQTCTGSKCAAVSTPKKALGQPCAGGADCLSDRCDSSKCVPGDGTGNLGDFCTKAAQCRSATCTGSKCTTPPPTQYDAYGSWLCDHWCSSGACIGCCTVWSGAAVTAIMYGAVACHSAASIFFFLHIGCAIAEAIQFASVTWAASMCSSNCAQPYTSVSQTNPNSCALTK
jgi:hypothetical protein